LTIVGAIHWAMTEEGGSRGSPIKPDQPLITLTDATGEMVCYLEVPMEQLPADGI
jgi:hypothetical protein